MAWVRAIFEKWAFYHISNRSFEHMVVWRTSGDYDYFLQGLVKYLIDHPSLWLGAYAVLPDHFHLLLKNWEQGYEISEFVRKLQINYVMYYRKKHGYERIARGNSLFPQRFAVEHIKSQYDLDQIKKHINNNPVHHEIVKDIAHRPYTSLKKKL